MNAKDYRLPKYAKSRFRPAQTKTPLNWNSQIQFLPNKFKWLGTHHLTGLEVGEKCKATSLEQNVPRFTKNAQPRATLSGNWKRMVLWRDLSRWSHMKVTHNRKYFSDFPRVIVWPLKLATALHMVWALLSPGLMPDCQSGARWTRSSVCLSDITASPLIEQYVYFRKVNSDKNSSIISLKKVILVKMAFSPISKSDKIKESNFMK